MVNRFMIRMPRERNAESPNRRYIGHRGSNRRPTGAVTLGDACPGTSRLWGSTDPVTNKPAGFARPLLGLRSRLKV